MHTSGIQVAPIEHKGEARLALAFPYEKQRVARVRSLPGARWSQSRKCWHVPATEAAVQLLSERLSDLLVLPEELKPVSRTGLSSEASDNAGINTHSTVRLIQELLGHSDIKTTLRYTHVSQQTIQKIRSPFDVLFCEKYDKNGGNVQI